MNNTWEPLLEELDRWHQSGKRAIFWLRDDDATEPTKQLEQLLGLTDQYRISVCLAVIPKFTGLDLAVYLSNSQAVNVAVHGWSHENHALPGSKKVELSDHRSQHLVLNELQKGYCRLSNLHGDRFVPVLVPPWNRIGQLLIARLGNIGFQALSTFGPEHESPILEINTHIDVIDWQQGRRCGHSTETLVRMIVERLKKCRTEGGWVGILTHHLVHDTQVWDFLQKLFDVTGGHPAAKWTSIRELDYRLR